MSERRCPRQPLFRAFNPEFIRGEGDQWPRGNDFVTMDLLRERVAPVARAVWPEGAVTWPDICDDDLKTALARYQAAETQSTS
jgi:hypothetical protein